MHCVQRPSSHCGHQTSDGLEIWWISHIPQKDGELDMMLISLNKEMVDKIQSQNNIFLIGITHRSTLFLSNRILIQISLSKNAETQYDFTPLLRMGLISCRPTTA